MAGMTRASPHLNDLSFVYKATFDFLFVILFKLSESDGL